MSYHQITSEERYTIARLRLKRFPVSKIAKILGRTRARRRECRRKWYFTDEELQMVIALTRLDWSPEQVSGWLKEHGILSISHATIYRYVWYDFFYGGTLYRHLRQANKKRRKRHNSLDFRGIMSGKRHISERPKGAENKSRIGHSWERGLNENTNGLIRQYLPKGKSMAHITQKDCNRIAEKLNKRPRKILNYKTREQCYVGN